MSLRCPDLPPNSPEAIKARLNVTMFQMAHRARVTDQFEKAFPDYAVMLNRYSKSTIFASDSYNVPKLNAEIVYEELEQSQTPTAGSYMQPHFIDFKYKTKAN